MDQYNVVPNYNSHLVDILFELEEMKTKTLAGTTPSWLFYDIKNTLNLLESLYSARIEGNNTTLVKAAADATNRPKGRRTDASRQIFNIQNGIDFIDTNIDEGGYISLMHIREMHRLVTESLVDDGSDTPGQFRKRYVEIAHSNITTSDPNTIENDMAQLMDYINGDCSPKEQIIKVAMAHHRFVAIHPFDNGNGRTARLLTYAMLTKYGFLRKKKAVLNPSAIFCMDRNKYYEMLARADTLSSNGLLLWCEYVADGIRNEFEQMFQLLDREFTVDKLIIPAIANSRKNGLLDDDAASILKVAAQNDAIQSKDIAHLFSNTKSGEVQRSRKLSNMVEDGLLFRNPKKPRTYAMRFFNSRLLPFVLDNMNEAGLMDVREAEAH